MSSRRPWLLAAALLAVVLLTGGFLSMRGVPWRSGSSGGGREELTVERAALSPGQIVLTLKNHADDAIPVAQAIVNDAFVDFHAVDAGGTQLAIDYPWIEGESYEIELLTPTGASADFEIEDADASS